MIISFCGVDGSGKSTLAQRLANNLIMSNKKIKLVHVDKYMVFEPVTKIVRLLIKLKNSDSESNPALSISNKPFLLKLWMVVSIIDNLCRYVYFILLVFFGYTVICDRYFYDKLAGFIYHGYSNRLLVWLYLKLTPQCNYLFRLNISAQDAKCREVGDKHPYYFYSSLISIYDEIFKDISVINLNTGYAPEKNLEIVLLKIS